MFEALVERMHEVARRIDAGDAGAEEALQALLHALASADDPRSVGLYVFGAALARRLAGQTHEQANLYLSQFDVPQIYLFNLLGRAVPFVGLATRLANQAIARAIEGQDAPTVIDVGIGTGRQVCALLDALAESHRLPAALTVIGIEPSEWALDEARQNIAQAAARVSANVTFHAVLGSAESLTQGDFRRMRAACADRPVINASFALHHIADDAGRDQRNDVLHRLRRLEPALLVLSEPDVDHLQPNFYQRFCNCFAHFGAVFRTLDRLELEQRDRDALKVGFFGREITDILSSPDDQRSERHESASSWLSRLQATGFEAAFVGELPASGTDAVRLARHARHASIDAVDEPVVSIITAAPGGAVTPELEEAMERAPDSRLLSARAERFEPEAYLSLLAAVAAADDFVHHHEREFILRHAAMLGVAAPELLGATDVEAALARGRAASRRTREAVVRDLVFLARIDGDYSEQERRLIARIADKLGVSLDLAALEAMAAAPAEAAGLPAWFVEQWYLAQK